MADKEVYNNLVRAEQYPVNVQKFEVGKIKKGKVVENGKA